jgi:hypothetical protein
MSELQFSFKTPSQNADIASAGLINLNFDGRVNYREDECSVIVNVFGFYNVNNNIMHDYFEFESRLANEQELHKKFLYRLLVATDYSVAWAQQITSLMMPSTKGLTQNFGEVNFKRSVKRDVDGKAFNCYRVEKHLYYKSELREQINNEIASIKELLNEKGLGQDSEYVWCGGYLPDIQKVNATSLWLELEKAKEDATKKTVLKVVK